MNLGRVFKPASLILVAALTFALESSCKSTDSDDSADGATGFDTRPRASKCRAPSPTPYPLQATNAMAPLAFVQPTVLVPAGVPGQWFVVERAGRVLRAEHTESGWVAHEFLDLRARTMSSQGEDGMLGFALSPYFTTTGEFFVSYTAPLTPPNYKSVIARFVSRDGGLTADPSSEELVIENEKNFPGHNGGRIAFGLDRFLYAAFGDGMFGDPNKRAQNPSELFGKVLRLDVLGGKPYRIPSDNPYAQGNGRPEVYAIGFRNPWGMSFAPDGNLWMTDVGHSRWEEVNIVQKGGNYGWPLREGSHCLVAAPCDVPGSTDPAFEYPHVDGLAATGGFVYRGDRIPSLKGHYVFGDYVTGRIWGLELGPAPGKYVEKTLLDSYLSLSAFGEGEDHELYVLDFVQGGVYRLEPTEPRVDEPASLRSLECLDAAIPARMAEGMIPYDVISPLWSDGLDKERFFSIPDNTQIKVTAGGDWDLPSGSVVLKTFAHHGRRVETRMMARDGDRWLAYTFEWNEAQDDAVLLADGKEKNLGDLVWKIPSRSQCGACHTAAAGRTLGLERAQMDRVITYPNSRRANQVTTLLKTGMLAIPQDPQPTIRLVSPTSDAPIEDRARAYLHANCSHCHRDLGPGQGGFDLRATIPRNNMRLFCSPASNQDPATGGQGYVATPGTPEDSVLLRKISKRGDGQMPPLGTSHVDAFGTALIHDWIASVGRCDPPWYVPDFPPPPLDGGDGGD